jgi:hypothetical protein
MKILSVKGYELEKELPNTSEDFFNRSEVTFVHNGEEHTFHLLYVRYFEENMKANTPFEENPVFSIGDRDYRLADIVALTALKKFPQYMERKRMYINEEEKFAELFKDINVDEIRKMLEQL